MISDPARPGSRSRSWHGYHTPQSALLAPASLNPSILAMDPDAFQPTGMKKGLIQYANEAKSAAASAAASTEDPQYPMSFLNVMLPVETLTSLVGDVRAQLNTGRLKCDVEWLDTNIIPTTELERLVTILKQRTGVRTEPCYHLHLYKANTLLNLLEKLPLYSLTRSYRIPSLYLPRHNTRKMRLRHPYK
jgi:hypothetical protein